MVHIVLTGLLISLGLNAIMFLIAFVKKSDKLTDLSYALTFIALASTSYHRHTGLNLLLLGMIVLWAARIGGFLLYRVIRIGKDSRFDGVRENFIKFGQFWVGQALTVPIILLTSLLALSRPIHGGILMILGFFIWAMGFFIEAIADMQKYRFTSNPKNKGVWISSGVWKYSRHPNYFGEISIWVGVYLFTYNSLTVNERLIGLSSPLLISILLLFISGIPILEKSADKRWGKLTDYRLYKRRTSVLIPLPPKQ